MTHRPNGRQRSRNSWSTFLAVLVGVLASASAFTASASFGGGPSIAGHSADSRTTGKPANLRPDRFDATLNFGGLDDPPSALAAEDFETTQFASGLSVRLPAAFVVPADVARTRDGRTRAPPRA